jgi:hypothetical protein
MAGGSVTREPQTAWLAGCIAAPALLVCALFFADTIAGAVGARFLWPVPALTLADAVVLRNAGETAAQIINGADPNAPSPISRASSLFGRRALLPVDAAVITGETHMLQLLVDHGARLDEPTLMRLRCEAERIGEDRVARWIDARLTRPVTCDQ